MYAPNAMHVEPRMIPDHLRGGYTGRKFKVAAVESVTIPEQAGTWDGGSRETFCFIEMSTGRVAAASDNVSAPWHESRRDRTYTLKPGYGVRAHSVFCGTDMGLTFYVHPSDAAALLPERVELTDLERKVLDIIGGIKSAYRNDEYRRHGINEAERGGALLSLFNKGLIDRRTAITVKGRNARKQA